ncbi:carbohydrate-binding module 1 protein [Puccinia graminis f. sp. tritici]|uniref:Carbohydrate-binding module 1 protein n=1 Tax=Puccinia graminis f. sp. tritici TaxID=56615 RepID=A0A5B0N2M3_PUCGR|nr:carbohydrate-binding module 1 protein [Puccinia graminis f. sp. tritici]
MMTSTIHSSSSLLSLPKASNPKVIPSNSIIITSLPKIFFHPSLQLALRSHFDSYGRIITWNLLPDLARILVIYSHSEPAVLARAEMDHFVFEESEIKELFLSLLDPNDGLDHETTELFNDLKRTVIRVYFGPKRLIPNWKPIGQHAESEATTNHPSERAKESEGSDRLKPPSLEKNFLISPPGSPPVGWTQITEDAPNQKDLADDLCQRLRFLSVGDEADEESQEEEHKITKPGSLDSQQPANLDEIVILHAQPARQLPALKVQQIQASKPSPGMGIHLVKATIESMLASSSNKISPTPRPEIF